MTTRLCNWAARTAATGLVTLVSFGMAAFAQEKPTIKKVPAQSITSVEGVDSYREYCAVCHGKDAKGNGPAAAALKMPPTDLTTIAKRRGGKYPALEVQATITGDRAITAHGDPDMPMWGPVFKSFGASAEDQSYRLRIQNLVKYLESVQVK
jgi:mono/diheme cytochrome c family protein